MIDRRIAFNKIVRYITHGYDMRIISLNGSFADKLLYAIGTVTAGPYVDTIHNQDGSTEIFFAHRHYPRTINEIVPWLRTSLRYPLSLVIPVTILSITTNLLQTIAQNPSRLTHPDTIGDMAYLLLILIVQSAAHWSITRSELAIPVSLQKIRQEES